MKIVAITPDRKKDMLAAGIIHGLNTLGHEIIASDPGNNVINHYSEDYVVENSKDADVIIVFWGKLEETTGVLNIIFLIRLIDQM